MLTILCLFFALASAAETENRVVELTDATFNSLVKEKNTFVLFYTPWCSHSSTLRPDWKRLGATFYQTSVSIAQIDCQKFPETCKAQGVSNYPTIFYWKDGVGTRYNGPRDLASLRHLSSVVLAKPCLISQPSTCSKQERDFIEMLNKGGEARVQQEKEAVSLLMSSPTAREYDEQLWIKQRNDILNQFTFKQEL